MEKCIVFQTAVISAIMLFCSCATTGKTAKPAADAAKKSADTELVQQKNAEEAQKNSSLAAEKNFKEKIAGIDFTVVSAPKQTVKKVPFASSFVVNVKTSSGEPAADFPVTVSWPVSRDGDAIAYQTKNVRTDADGNVSFSPDAPSCSFDDRITFYPTPVSSDPALMQAAYDAGTAVPYKVRSDYARMPGVIYVFDFNEDGRPGTNSQYLLRELINSGVRIGNSPIPTSSYLTKPVESLYRATYNIVGNAYAFMICGTVKYVKPIEAGDGGKYSCQLAADVSCVNMKDGSILYTTEQTYTAAAESKYKALDNCRKALAAKTAHAILYGM